MESLAAVVSRMGPLLEAEAVGWVVRLARRVEGLHQSGSAHGSISADAIVVDGHSPTAGGRLLDPHESARVPGYQCPERDVFGRPTAAEDAWAIGVTLYVLLTGSLPYGGGSDVEVRQRMAQGSFAPLSVFGVDDEELQRLVERLLARAQAQRVTRVSDLRSLLEGWGAALGVGALPPLEGGGVAAAPPPDDDDDDDNAATQIRDVGDIQALIAAATAAPLASPPQVAAPPTSPAQPDPRLRPDARRGTLLGVGISNLPVGLAAAAPQPPPSSAPPASPVLPAFPAAPATPVAPAFPTVAPPLDSAPPAQARPPARELQPTMRSLGVPPEVVSRPRPPVVEVDDDEGNGGATLMLDAGPLDVNAAIADELSRAGGAPAAARTEPIPGGGSAVEQLLDRPWRASAPGPEALAGMSAQAPLPSAGALPPQGAHGAMPGAPTEGNPWMNPQASAPSGLVPPTASAPTTEGRGLKIALAVGIVLLVTVVSVVVVLYLKKQG